MITAAVEREANTLGVSVDQNETRCWGSISTPREPCLRLAKLLLASVGLAANCRIISGSRQRSRERSGCGRSRRILDCIGR